MKGQAIPISDALLEPFVREIMAAKGDPWRQNQLLAYLRLRQSEKLEDLARSLVLQKETRWHSLEIQMRNGVSAGNLPDVPEKNQIKIDGKTGACLVLVARRMGSKINQEFWMGKYPVTNLEYRHYLNETGGAQPRFWEEKRFNSWDQPVVNISWDDMHAKGGYLEWSGMRLPDEVEWEYACRAGTVGDFSFAGGEEDLVNYAWCGKNSGDRTSGRPSTHGVGLKRPNDRGLFDMHGNVWEWCENLYDNKSTTRVLRGGSWYDSTEMILRSSRRGSDLPSRRDDNYGFRCVVSSAR